MGCAGHPYLLTFAFRGEGGGKRGGGKKEGRPFAAFSTICGVGKEGGEGYWGKKGEARATRTLILCALPERGGGRVRRGCSDAQLHRNRSLRQRGGGGERGVMQSCFL